MVVVFELEFVEIAAPALIGLLADPSIRLEDPGAQVSDLRARRGILGVQQRTRGRLGKLMTGDTGRGVAVSGAVRRRSARDLTVCRIGVRHVSVNDGAQLPKRVGARSGASPIRAPT